MKLADFGVTVFTSDLARDMKLASLGVKVKGLDPDGEVCVDALRGCRAGRFGFFCHAANSRGGQKV